MTKEAMLTLVIRRWGLEHPYTIQFAESMEWLGLVELEALMNEVLWLPQIEDEEEGWD